MIRPGPYESCRLLTNALADLAKATDMKAPTCDTTHALLQRLSSLSSWRPPKSCNALEGVTVSVTTVKDRSFSAGFRRLEREADQLKSDSAPFCCSQEETSQVDAPVVQSDCRRRTSSTLADDVDNHRPVYLQRAGDDWHRSCRTREWRPPCSGWIDAVWQWNLEPYTPFNQ